MIVALFDGGITRGEGNPFGFVTEIDKYTLVLLRNTQKAPISVATGAGNVSALKPEFVI
jgi:hypothetical protein